MGVRCSISRRSAEELPCTTLFGLDKLRKFVNDSQVQFLVGRECVLEDALCTVQWPNFSVYDRVMVSLYNYFLYLHAQASRVM